MHRGPLCQYPQAVPQQGVYYPRQLILDRTAGMPDWLIPTYMPVSGIRCGNPGWLKPLQLLMQRVEAKALFHRLDRSEGTEVVPGTKRSFRRYCFA